MQDLDAFGYWPENRSRISGLGGKGDLPDPNYVFHSVYVELEPGPSYAEVQFKNLRAQSGLLAISVFQHRPAGSPAITEQGKTTALLPAIGKTKRAIQVGFEVLPDAKYAILGQVLGECEARAKGLDLRVGRMAGEDEDPTRRRSLFGRMRARRVTKIASIDAPSLAWPVSQGFSDAQLAEPEFALLADRLPARATPMERWESAYIVQVLEKYGRLDAGARGLGLTMSTDPVASIAAAGGCDITSLLLGQGESIDDAALRAFPDPDAGRGFDFIWSRSNVFGSGGPERALGLIAELLERLRPGGLGIHMVMLGAGEMDDNALNRVMLGLAAEGQIVAQLRIDRTGKHPDGPIPFGMVVRKSTDRLMV